MVYIHVKNWEHQNKALPNWNDKNGRYISSKKQYVEECKRAGLIPFEQAEELRAKNEDKARQNRMKHNPETLEFLNSVKDKADKKGKVKLSDNQIGYMIKKGAIKDRDVYSKYLPEHYQPKGGWK
jgi:hypothetical protein